MRSEVPVALGRNSSSAPIEPMVASSAGPVLEEGKDPFLLLTKELGFGAEGSLEENTSTECTIFMSFGVRGYRPPKSLCDAASALTTSSKKRNRSSMISANFGEGGGVVAMGLDAGGLGAVGLRRSL
jgi:hypothetical protein